MIMEGAAFVLLGYWISEEEGDAALI